MTGIACVLAGCAALLLAPPRAALGRGRRGRRGSSYVVGGLGLCGAGWWLADEPRLLVLGAVAGAAALAAGRLVARHRADRAAARVRSRVVELCDGLQAELAAGQTATVALERVAGEWPALLPVTRSAAAGGDVPGAFRELAAGPGAGDLRVVAAAWQVAHRTGHGLADALGRVAQELRDAEQTRRVVTGELASARATARLVACLPLVALLMGSGAGADPWGFLLGHPVGLGCLAGGVGCGIAGLAWIEALARDVERGR
ncbi:type II secretion system protein [Nocardioides immobilis]|uniref:Type II secretion system protein n=1 Tax=Nocardioides immobilis TaxID=2049295 RepID=A0A417Y278_9ACTN|nr:type II secretion system F family protein [Nocardioides immobilis]RHW26753.1 type II secretion system protein [Nocardioides immobilis]